MFYVRVNGPWYVALIFFPRCRYSARCIGPAWLWSLPAFAVQSAAEAVSMRWYGRVEEERCMHSMRLERLPRHSVAVSGWAEGTAGRRRSVIRPNTGSARAHGRYFRCYRSEPKRSVLQRSVNR